MTSAIQPLSVVPFAVSAIPDASTDAYAEFIDHYTKLAFKQLAESRTWKQGKTHRTPEGGEVHTRSAPSNMTGRPGKLAWHLRESVHPTSQSKITYETYRQGLLLAHQLNEPKYIPTLTYTRLLETIKEGEAEVWLNSYKLPTPAAKRDFVQLILLRELPDHPKPFSEEHLQATLRRDPPGEAVQGGKRGFLVIQMPVLHDDAPKTQGYVRGEYASIEAVYESEEPDTVEWRYVTPAAPCCRRTRC